MQEVQEKKLVRIAPIQSVERAIWILKCFEGHTALSLSEISRMLSMHKSTVFGLVSTLEIYHLLEQDQDSGKYRLGIELFRMGSKVNINLRGIAAPYMDKLVSLCGETVNLVIPDGDSVVYLEKKESPHSIRIATSLGQREPLYRTATGKAILAKLPPETVQNILQRTKFERMTSNTLLSVNEVQQQLAAVRRMGYAIDNEELEYGLVCLGVAIVDSTSKPVGAISVSGPAFRMTEENRRVFAEYLIDCGRQISAQL